MQEREAEWKRAQAASAKASAAEQAAEAAADEALIAVEEAKEALELRSSDVIEAPGGYLPHTTRAHALPTVQLCSLSLLTVWRVVHCVWRVVPRTGD